MRAITADIYTNECSPIAEADTFGELPANLRLITEEEWAAEPLPGQLWEGNIPATFYPDPETLLANAKAAKLDAVNARLAVAFGAGFTVPIGTMAGQVLQVRDTEDRTNWLTSQATYSTMVTMGRGGEEGAEFRCANNSTHTVTYQEGLQVLLLMAKWGADIMARSWALKDAIRAATNDAELGAIDVEAGWP